MFAERGKGMKRGQGRKMKHGLYGLRRLHGLGKRKMQHGLNGLRRLRGLEKTGKRGA